MTMVPGYTVKRYGFQMRFSRESYFACAVLPDELKKTSLVDIDVRPIENPAQLLVEAFFPNERSMLYLTGVTSSTSVQVLGDLVEQAQQNGMVEGSFMMLTVYTNSPQAN